MHIRKILIAGSALAAAAAFALVPAAQASTPGGDVDSIHVGSNTSGSYPITGTLKSGTSVTMEVYGSPMKLGCTTGSLAGTVHAGSPAPNPVFNFTSLSMICDGPSLYDFYAEWSAPTNGCANWRWSDSALVHDTLTDYGPKGAKFQEVLGSINLPTGCNMTVISGPCTITVGGATTSNFYEAKSSTNATQGLNLEGSGLTVRSASFLCLGLVSVGDALTMNNFDFNVGSVNGAIDLRDN